MGFPATSPHHTNLNWPTKVPLCIFGSQPLDTDRKLQSLFYHLCGTLSNEKGVGEKWAGCWVSILNPYNNESLLNRESHGTDGDLSFPVFK